MLKITLTNREVNLLNIFLRDLKLEDKEAFARRRFIRQINGFVQDLEDERMILNEKFATKKDGKPVLNENKDGYEYTTENKKLLNKEWDKLNELTFNMEVSDANEPDVMMIVNVVTRETNKIVEKNEKKMDYLTHDLVATMQEIVEKLVASKQ